MFSSSNLDTIRCDFFRHKNIKYVRYAYFLDWKPALFEVLDHCIRRLLAESTHGQVTLLKECRYFQVGPSSIYKKNNEKIMTPTQSIPQSTTPKKNTPPPEKIPPSPPEKILILGRLLRYKNKKREEKKRKNYTKLYKI